MENVESVCYIGEITNISPILGADKIEQTKCGNWTCVVQKGIHKEGNRVLCITQDAVIPENLAIKFGVLDYLRKRKKAGQLTVRTVKLKGVYSECILIPLEVCVTQVELAKLGMDMQNVFNIYKYEEPEQFIEFVGKNGKRIRQVTNPNFHVYYKFPNAKNISIFKDGDAIVITRKIHGANARYGLLKKPKFSLWTKIKKFFGAKMKVNDLYEFVYGSRQVQKGKGDSGFYKSDYWLEQAKELKIREKMETFFSTFENVEDGLGNGIIIYGEVYGAGVQGEKYTYGLRDRSLAIFDVLRIRTDGSEFYLPEEIWRNMLEDIKLGENFAPILYQGPWSEAIETEYSQGVKIEGTDVPHEGIVVKDPSGVRNRIYKVINKDYHIFAEKHDVPDGH